MNKHFYVITGLILLGFVCAPYGSALAEEPKFGVGVRPAGVSFNPDQFTVGVQAILWSIPKARLEPSVDFGWGDDVSTTSFNIDAKVDLLSLPGTSSRFFLGAGQTIIRISPDGGETDTEIGASLLGGLKVPFGTANSYNIEVRFGIGDIPEVKLVVGAMFGFGSH